MKFLHNICLRNVDDWDEGDDDGEDPSPLMYGMTNG